MHVGNGLFVCLFLWSRDMIRIILSLLVPILKMRSPDRHGNRDLGWIKLRLCFSLHFSRSRKECIPSWTSLGCLNSSKVEVRWRGPRTLLLGKLYAAGWSRCGLQPHIMRSKKLLEETVLLHHCPPLPKLHSYTKYLHHWSSCSSTGHHD